jgi:hypothetical protein
MHAKRTKGGRAMTKIALAIATVATCLVGAAAATAQGLTPEQLTKAGWTCFPDPTNPRIVCLNPGHPRPSVPADPDGQQSLQDMVFGLDGSFRGTIHLIRADLYQGQPCPQTGGSYLFIPRIGYYSCENV